MARDYVLPTEGLRADRFVSSAVLDEWLRPLVAEFLGPFALVLFGAGSFLTAASYGFSNGGTVLLVALAHGLAIGLVFAAAGHISGGHYNPAVSIALWLAGRLGTLKAAAYVVAQLAGAIVAAAVLRYVFPGEIWDPVHLGAPVIAKAGAAPIIVGRARGFWLELIMTFVLMYVMFGAALDKRGPGVVGALAIGLAYSVGVMLGGPLTGAAMNPARQFGPAVVANYWTDGWIYWVAPIAGAAAAALLYAWVLMPPGQGRSWPAGPED